MNKNRFKQNISKKGAAFTLESAHNLFGKDYSERVRRDLAKYMSIVIF